MTQHFPLDYGDVVHQGFFDPIQELLGASLPSLRVRVSNNTTLRVTAGSGNEQVTAAIMGRYRFITSDITASIGSITSGTASVFLTASDNDFSGTPTGPPDVATNYGFNMEIRATGNPSAALYRKVGEVDVSGGAIVAFRPMGGPRPSGEFGLVATADNADQPALLVRNASGQNAASVRVTSNTGTVVYQVGPGGATTQAGGITTTSTDGITVSGNAGKTAVNLTNTSGTPGITMGDVEVYRASTDTLQTDDRVVIRRLASADLVLSTKVTNDSNDRVSINAGGDLRFGSGSAAPDVRVRRSGTTTITIDSTAAGSANLSVAGEVTIGTTLRMTQATTAGHVPISNGSGQMILGQLGSSSIATSAVTTDKIEGSAVTSAKIADGTIVNADISTSANIAESKLSLASDAAAGTASRRTLGTGATQACAGNDSRLSNSRTPTGSAGGTLAGSYPNPDIAVQSAVATPTMGGFSGWTDAPTCYKYYQNSLLSMVVLRGKAEGFTIGSGSQQIMTLPSGFRPSQTVDIVTVVRPNGPSGSALSVIVTITDLGIVSAIFAAGYSTPTVEFTGVTFYV